MLSPLVGSNIPWLVKFLIQTYFTNLHGIVVVYDFGNLTRLKLDYLDGIREAMSEANRVSGEFLVSHWVDVHSLKNGGLNCLMLANAELGSQGYISLLDNSTMLFESKYNATESSIVRQMDKKFLLLTETEEPTEILAGKYFSWYPGHLLVQPTPTGDVKLWSQKYVGIETSDDAVLLDIFYKNKTFQKNTNLYPDKFKNLQGRALNISSAIYIPYAMPKFVGTGKGTADSIGTSKKNMIFEGIEGEVMSLYCKYYNCTLKIVTYGLDGWGGIYDNGSSDGLLGALYRKEVDFAICCLYKWYSDFFDLTYITARSAVTLLVPAPMRYPEYLTTILPFTSTVWAFVIITVVITSLVYHILKILLIKWQIGETFACEGYSFTALEVAAIYFQQSTILKFRQISGRLCLAVILISGMILENSYSGALKSLLTIPKYMDPIDTTAKFVTSGLKWGAPHPAWVMTLYGSENHRDQAFVQSYETRSYEDLRNLSFSGKYSVAIERLYSGNFAFGKYIEQDAIRQLILLKDDLYFEYTYGYSLRGWPLMESFNMFLMWISQHGIFSTLEEKTVAEYLDRDTEQGILTLSSSKREKPVPVVLNVSHISSQLFLLCIGYLFALVVFLCEIMFYHFFQKDNFKCKLRLDEKKI